jgi:adenylate cyclase
MKRGSFRWRLALMAVAVGAIPLLVAAWFLIDVNRRALEDATRERLFAVTEDVAHTVDGTLAEAETALTAVAGALSDSAPADERISVASRLVEASPSIATVGVYDGDGHRVDVLAEGGVVEAIPEELDAGIRANALRAPPFVTDALAVAKGPRVLMILPLRGARATWFVAAPISLAALQSRIEALSRDAFGDDLDSVFVVDRTRRTIAHPDPERALALETAPSYGVLANLPVDASGHPEPLLVYGVHQSPRGKTVAVARSLDDLPWIVVAQRPHDLVFAPIAQIRKTIALAIAALCVLAIIASLVWSWRLASPIAKLVAYAGDLAHRRFDRTVQLHTGDELETLATAMSAAAHDLGQSETRLLAEQAIRRDLGRYLPGELVEQIVRRDAEVTLGGESREVTIMFADVTSFTSLVERLPAPEVVALLNQIFTMMTEVIFANGGTVDKLIGDSVMAFWGAPRAQENHATRAIRAAQAILRWVEVMNEGWQSTFGATIHIAIGVNTGAAVVGNVGSETRMDYTCVGDTVNVASRLEALARPQQILASGSTRDAAPTFRYLEIGSYAVPGRSEPVELWEVLSR